MATFSEKPLFTLKQLIAAISASLLIGGGIARFELKTSNIETKLDDILAMVTQEKIKNDIKFTEISRLIAINASDLKAVTTSLTAIKPKEIRIRRRR